MSGVEGEWKGQTFYPKTTGDALLTVTSGEVSATLAIKVTQPKALHIEPSILQVEENSTKKVQVYGVDGEGYKVPLDASKMVWQSSKPSVQATHNEIHATSETTATLTASYQGLEGKVEVIVGESIVRIESFEEHTASWASTGTAVQGKVEPSKEVRYHGDQALKMTYTFDKATGKQVAYTVFDTPIPLQADAKSVNMWLNARGQGDTVKVQIQDANGKTHHLQLVEALDFTGWKYTSVPIPAEIAMPAKVTKLYAYTEENKEKRTSALYIDHVSITRGMRDDQGALGRKDHHFDAHYKETLQAPTGNQYMVKVTGPTAVTGMQLNTQQTATLTNNLSRNAAKVIQASNENLALGLQSTLSYQNEYLVDTYQNMSTVFVGTGKGSIRTQNEDQWLTLKQTLDQTESQHIILVMGHNPLTQFQDAREGQALHDYLVSYKERTGKNIFVVTSGGTYKEVRIEEGIRYMNVNGLQTSTGQVPEGECLTFKVVGNEIYYTFETII